MIIQNAKIQNAKLTIDNNKLTLWMYLDYGNSNFYQGFGGYNLKSFKSTCECFITRCMEIAEVEDFNDLKEKCIRVKKKDEGIMSTIIEIGHIIKYDWFNPSEDFKKI